MSRPIIEVHGISKQYRLGVFDAGSFREEINRTWERLRGKVARPASSERDFWALRDVSFTVQQGDVLGVIGRNGAGKSTLLKILSRITEPTSGRAVLRGRVASLLEVGTGFHPELSGRENVYLNGAILGMRHAEITRKFDEIVAFAEVDRFIDTPVKRYSSGMHVRLAFAVAAHLEPEILIIDEVLAVGDTIFQRKCLSKVSEIATGGRTVLFVSHNLDAIERLCSRCLLFSSGRLVRDGKPREAIEEYAVGLRPLAPDVALHTSPRSLEGSGAARFTKIECEPQPGCAPWTIPFGAPIAFTTSVEVLRPMDEVEIGYSICSLTGYEIASSTTCQEGELHTLSPGTYSLRTEIPNLQLSPGRYVLGVGIASHYRTVDHIREAVEIEICPTEESQANGFHKVLAACVPKSRYELSRGD